MSTVLVGGFWVAAISWVESDACESTPENPYGCLGAALLVVFAGLPLLALVVAVVLSGRGLRHSVIGGIVSVAVGTAVVYKLAEVVQFTGPDVVGWALTAPVVGLIAAGWSVKPSSRRPASSEDRCATEPSTGARDRSP